MDLAIVGFGTAGEARLSAYATIEDARVACVVDPSPDRRARAAAHGLDGFADLGSMLATTTVDAIDVCAPPAFHAELVTAGLTAGCHVICEKPVAFEAAQAADLVARSRRTGRLLYPAHNYGFSPMMRMFVEAVAEPIGGPMTASFTIRRPTHARGVSSWRPDWRRDPAMACGGILLDHGTHCIYMATRLFGALPTKVSCTTILNDQGLDHAAEATLRFPNGSCEIALSWISDERSNLYELSGPAGSVSLHDGQALITGPNGSEVRELISPTGSGTHEEWFADMFADFAYLVDRPQEWGRPLDETLGTAQIIEAAYRSAARNGTAVSVDG
ncbi:gfo/Idh/MocA family oxidoreductase [Actinomadura logoneensis]|uniref:Gfo/Idh/MocA family oxidoreductase n=1 Tax=Actinomadura logoneensis TaxID=2293572 RepID=A0A372JPY6_9ACTN|nr:Gfo/Idh/MocA family oxidoreductase [Actinomadura logoneensis]RFU41876.1 gfo/Idh/MocA family oxidoreductase [Actinomadura logoneensis]